MEALKEQNRWEEVAEGIHSIFDYGEVITLKWLYKAFGIEMPTPMTPKHVSDKRQWDFFSMFENCRNALRENYSMHLHNIRGEGYLIVEPQNQTSVAEKNGKEKIGKEIDRCKSIIEHVNYGRLNEDQKRENRDALCRVTKLQGFFRRTLK
jgi:hypothetical protein